MFLTLLSDLHFFVQLFSSDASQYRWFFVYSFSVILIFCHNTVRNQNHSLSRWISISGVCQFGIDVFSFLHPKCSSGQVARSFDIFGKSFSLKFRKTFAHTLKKIWVYSSFQFFSRKIFLWTLRMQLRGTFRKLIYQNSIFLVGVRSLFDTFRRETRSKTNLISDVFTGVVIL